MCVSLKVKEKQIFRIPLAVIRDYKLYLSEGVPKNWRCRIFRRSLSMQWYPLPEAVQLWIIAVHSAGGPTLHAAIGLTAVFQYAKFQ